MKPIEKRKVRKSVSLLKLHSSFPRHTVTKVFDRVDHVIFKLQQLGIVHSLFNLQVSYLSCHSQVVLLN